VVCVGVASVRELRCFSSRVSRQDSRFSGPEVVTGFASEQAEAFARNIQPAAQLLVARFEGRLIIGHGFLLDRLFQNLVKVSRTEYALRFVDRSRSPHASVLP